VLPSAIVNPIECAPLPTKTMFGSPLAATLDAL